MKCFLGLVTLAWVLPASGTVVGGSLTDELDDDDEGHHHHHHGHHHKHKKPLNQSQSDYKTQKEMSLRPLPAVATKAQPVVKAAVQGSSIVEKMKKLEAELAEKAKGQVSQVTEGHILVNGPLPADFNERFAQAVGQATGADAKKVLVTGTKPLEDNADIVEISFEAPSKVVKEVENDAADPNSKLAQGNLRPFLIAKSKESSYDASAWHEEKWEAERDAERLAEARRRVAEHEAEARRLQAKADHETAKAAITTGKTPQPQPENYDIAHEESAEKKEKPEKQSVRVAVRHDLAEEATPVEEKGIDIDTAMPYGDLEPFGREDTAQELTESSVKESDEMVDQLERAEVAEEKRSVFRALTRLRGAAITSFDGVARSQTGNIDEYNKIHKWRKTHPLHHLADEESDVTKWAFPDNADF